MPLKWFYYAALQDFPNSIGPNGSNEVKGVISQGFFPQCKLLVKSIFGQRCIMWQWQGLATMKTGFRARLFSWGVIWLETWWHKWLVCVIFVFILLYFCFFESDKGIFWLDLPKKKWLVCWLLSHVLATGMAGLSRYSLQLLMYWKNKTWYPFGKISHASIKNHSVPDLRHFLKLPCVFPQQYYNRKDFWKTVWSKSDVV